uniref:Uncharacterized protein n=1 Tax=Nelumbo nucifera TaxID=4432 RepID=A0A822XMW1_NELNU|nr:TPA_asm: hypothetical protein HUJ06_021862 [Nelumbo nucifera]
MENLQEQNQEEERINDRKKKIEEVCKKALYGKVLPDKPINAFGVVHGARNFWLNNRYEVMWINDEIPFTPEKMGARVQNWWDLRANQYEKRMKNRKEKRQMNLKGKELIASECCWTLGNP